MLQKMHVTDSIEVIEILPYTIDSKCISVFWLVTGACGTFNTHFNPLGVQAFQWKFYFFYIAWIAAQFAVVYIFFIETKGPSLERIALLFDGKDVHVSYSDPVGENIIADKLHVEVRHVESV
jgi:hypothetical protein